MEGANMDAIQAQVAAAMKDVLDNIKHKYKEFQESEPLWSVIQGFIHAIDWKERWIQGLVAAQVLILLLAVLTRKSTTAQTCLFALATGIVFMGERLNALGRQHWREFSKQNYFDASGVFWGVMVAGPLLCSLFVILINYLRMCVSLLIKAKRAELKHRARQRQQHGDGQAAPQEGKKDK